MKTFLSLALGLLSLTVSGQGIRQALLGASRVVPSAAAAATINADVYIDFEDSTDGTTLTTTILTNGTHDAANHVTWSISSTASNLTTSTAFEQTLLESVTVNGVAYTDSGSTRSYRNAGAAAPNYIMADFKGSHDIAVVGFWLKLPSDTASFNTEDFCMFKNDGGGYTGLQAFMGNPNEMYLHYLGGSGTTLVSKPPTGIPYWYTMLADNGGTCKLAMFDTNGVQVGTAVRNTDTGTGNWMRINWGATDSSGTTSPYWYDDLTLYFDDATKWPLGPKSSPWYSEIVSSGNNTASASWAVSHPAAVANDLLIFHIVWDDTTATTNCTAPAGPNGETLTEIVATPVTDTADAQRAKAWYCKTTGTWAASTITFTPSASEQWTATCVLVKSNYFDATTPIGATGTNYASAAGTSVTNATFTAGSTDGGGRLLWFAGVDTVALGNTPPTGWNIQTGTDRGVVAEGVALRTALVTNSESISASTWTISSETWTSIGVVVRKP